MSRFLAGCVAGVLILMVCAGLVLIGVGFFAFGVRNPVAQVVPAPVQATTTSPPRPTTVPTQVPPTAKPTVQVAAAKTTNGLTSPVLHHADSQPPENGVGSFDVGVHKDQVGLAFGWHIAWPKGNVDAGGGGCNLVILTPGWYENLQVTDGRYEVYDIPSSDYPGWVKVLGQQRADEQAKDYKCPQKGFSDLPQWKSPISSPP